MKPTCDVFRAEDFICWYGTTMSRDNIETLAMRVNETLLSRATVVTNTWPVETVLRIEVPIAKPDTAESLLKELINCWSHENMISIDQFVERARKLLEGK
jgi:hypothetical protein